MLDFSRRQISKNGCSLFFTEKLFSGSPGTAEGFKRAWLTWSKQLPEANLDGTIFYFFPEDGAGKKNRQGSTDRPYLRRE